jgi:hypothetical protein
VKGNCRIWLTTFAAAGLCLALADSSAFAQPAADLLTGAAFRQQLQQPVNGSWSDRSLREALASLSRTARIAIFLDRRIDGERIVELEVRNQPLQNVLDQLAALADAGTTTVGPVVFVGPRETAAALPALTAQRRQEVARLSGDAKTKLLRAAAWQWDDLAQPGQLLSDLAGQAGATIENPHQIPHDLWPAASLPPLPWADRLSLLLAGFGQTFEFVAGPQFTLRLVPAPAAAAAQPVRPPTSSSQTAIEPAKKAGRPSGERYSLTVGKNTPAGAVVRRIAQDLGKELTCDAAVLAKLQQEITLSVSGVTLHELLTATLQPLGLTYKITADELQIVPRE